MSYLTKLFEVEAFFVQAEHHMHNKQKNINNPLQKKNIWT